MMRKGMAFLLYSFLLLAACQPNARIAKVETSTIPLDTQVVSAGDSASLATILPYRARLEKEMNEVIGYSDTVMMKGNPESLLGNFIADLVLTRTNAMYKPSDGKKADLCLLNNGGLRTTLPSGAITRGRIFELMPFENEIVILTLEGRSVQELCKYLASINGAPVSGMRMGIRKNEAVDVLIGGEKFDPGKTYKVVTSDYLASGGDKMSFFNNPVQRDTLHYKIRDAILDHIRDLHAKGWKVTANLDRRIHHE